MNREHPDRHHRQREDEAQPDRLDDLRAQLPGPFRDAPDAEIARLWLAWDAARHGHRADYLTGVLAISDQDAEELVSLAQGERGDAADTRPTTPT
jgi:hypothetical protein